MRSLQVDGVGSDVKHASVISKEQENLLWKKEVLTVSTPLGLLRDGSKNRSGGFRDLKVENKVVPVFANPSAGQRCHVFLIDTYLSKLPPKVREQDYFYARPLSKISRDQPWYACSPLGENKLGSMVKDMFKEVGITGKSNHSLCATCLYSANVPETIIQQTLNSMKNDL